MSSYFIWKTFYRVAQILHTFPPFGLHLCWTDQITNAITAVDATSVHSLISLHWCRKQNMKLMQTLKALGLQVWNNCNNAQSSLRNYYQLLLWNQVILSSFIQKALHCIRSKSMNHDEIVHLMWFWLKWYLIETNVNLKQNTNILFMLMY